KEMQAKGDFLIDSWFLSPDFAGHPQKRDFIAQLIDNAGALALGPPLLLELDEEEVNAAMLFEHGDPLCLGWMGRDDRTDVRYSQPLANLLCVNAELRRVGDDIGDGALDRRLATHAFGLAAQPHRRVLLDDRQELEPDPMGLENAGERFRDKNS